MALNLGKKKDTPADDWSDSALEADAGSTPGTTEPADAFGDTIAADTAPPRKNLAPIMLAAGAVLLLTAVGLSVYFLFLNKPAQDADAPIMVQQRPDAPATPEGTPADPADVAKNPAKPADAPNKIVVKPAPKTVAAVPPGRTGIVPPGTAAPAVQPEYGKPAAAVPKPNQPRPIDIMRDGVAGQQGKGLPIAAAVPVVQPQTSVSPDVMSQLKKLWLQGAAAKHRGDKAAAKRAWQKMLQLRPGHPGVQEAIDKL